jgi:hypothetical protein
MFFEWVACKELHVIGPREVSGMTNETRRELLAHRDEIRRHLQELSKGTHSRGSSPARRHTSKQMLRYLLDNIERKLAGTDKHERK